jgi:hypothetical protein
LLRSSNLCCEVVPIDTAVLVNEWDINIIHNCQSLRIHFITSDSTYSRSRSWWTLP